MRHDPIHGDNQGVTHRAGKVDLRVGEGTLQGDGGGVVSLDRDVKHGTGQTLDGVGRTQRGDLTRPSRPSSIVTETGVRFKPRIQIEDI